jgi:catechol 2,3-dioxygenase-like lactoylglutathione lyase family enzyme
MTEDRPMKADLAVPILPCRSLDETLHFYGRLGFYTHFRQDRPDGYAIVHRGRLELHFFAYPELDPAVNYAGCYLRVGDVAEMAATWGEAGLPGHGIPRMTRVEDKPWGMREFAVVDPNGNLLRVGQPV